MGDVLRGRGQVDKVSGLTLQSTCGDAHFKRNIAFAPSDNRPDALQNSAMVSDGMNLTVMQYRNTCMVPAGDADRKIPIFGFGRYKPVGSTG